jgi:hypothetical protein
MVASKVSKLEVARDQLDAAIELFFLSDKLIAVHTLTAAAYNVLADLSKRDGGEFPFIKSGFIASLKESERSKVWAFLTAPENFFKHADRDPDDILEFDPELTEMLLLDACSYFKARPSHRPRHFNAIKLWAGTLRSDIPVESELGQLTLTLVQAFKSGGKKAFWELYCKLKAVGPVP